MLSVQLINFQAEKHSPAPNKKITPGLCDRERALLLERVKKSMNNNRLLEILNHHILHAILLKITNWCSAYWFVLCSVTDIIL